MGIRSELKRELIKVKSELTDVNYVKSILIIFLLEILLIIFTIYIVNFTHNIIKDLNSIYQNFWYTAVILGALPVTIFYLFDKLGEIKKLEQLKNRFLHLSILVVLLTTFGSLSIIDTIYESQFPINFVLNNFNNISTEVNCYSLNREFTYPIKGQFLDCYVTVDFQKNITNISFTGASAEIAYYLNSSDYKEINFLGYVESNKINTTFLIKSIRFKIEQEGLVDLIFIFKFNDNENNIESRSSFKSFTAINFEDYDRKKSEELQYKLAAIGIALTASFVGIKNFMDIWDREENKKRMQANGTKRFNFSRTN